MSSPNWTSARFPKPLLPILIGVAAVGLAAVMILQHQKLQQLGSQLVLSRQQVQQLEARNETLTQQVAGLEADRQGLDARVQALREELASATMSLDQSRVSLEDLQVRFGELKATREMLATQVSSVSQERDEARQRAQALQQDQSEMERAVLRLRERLTLMDRDYRQLAAQLAEAQATPNQGVGAVSSTGPASYSAGGAGAAVTTALSPGTVELPPIVVRRDQAGMSIPVRGRIVEVNEPHHFIVVDKGSMDGVHVGMMFDLVRGASTIGRAAVVRVRPQLSACDILRAKTPGPLQAGDQAVQSATSAR